MAAVAQTAIHRYAGHIDLFTVGTDNRVYSSWWDGNGGWRPWFAIGNLLCRSGSTVAALARPAITLTVHHSQRRPRDPPGDARTGWADWLQLQGGVASSGAPVTAVAPPHHLTSSRRHRQPHLQHLYERSGWSNCRRRNPTCARQRHRECRRVHPDQLTCPPPTPAAIVSTGGTSIPVGATGSRSRRRRIAWITSDSHRAFYRPTRSSPSAPTGVYSTWWTQGALGALVQCFRRRHGGWTGGSDLAPPNTSTFSPWAATWVWSTW